MASISEEDLCCPVCQDVFRDPVVLSCSHSFCKVCLQDWWKEKPIKECPLCKRKSSKDDPPLNLVLKNVCESFLFAQSKEPDEDLCSRDQTGSESICVLHSEKLKLFCLDHEEPVCLICRDSQKHKDHQFRPIEEATQENKKELEEAVKALKDELQVHIDLKVKCDRAVEHIEVQARQTERQIQDQFKKLHHFLWEEEESKIRALREEEEQKSQRMKEKMEAVSREIEALTEMIQSTEDHLRHLFLHKHKAAVKRVQQRSPLEDPQLGSGALIDQAKHLGNLGFNIWNNMKDLVSYSPVVLDPNTAHDVLIVSEDLTSVRRGEEPQRVPENPERIRFSFSVLGSEGFSSGTHSWEVNVADSETWILGAATKTVDKVGKPFEMWGMWLLKGRYSAGTQTGGFSLLRVQKVFQKIQVNLDFNRRKLTFSDPDTNTNIHTISHNFTGNTLIPFLSTVGPLQISPLKIYVNLGRPSGR